MTTLTITYSPWPDYPSPDLVRRVRLGISRLIDDYSGTNEVRKQPSPGLLTIQADFPDPEDTAPLIETLVRHYGSHVSVKTQRSS